MEALNSSETTAAVYTSTWRNTPEYLNPKSPKRFTLPFTGVLEVIAVAETWLDGQPSEFIFEWVAKVRVWSL